MVLLVSLPLFAFAEPVLVGVRDYRSDLDRAAGRPLTVAESELAQFSLSYSAFRAGASLSDGLNQALAKLSAVDYAAAIVLAWTVAKQPAAKGLLKLGKFGEKLLKAIIVTAEDAFAAAGKAIDDKATEYDERK